MPARDAEYWSGVEPGFHGPQLRDLPQQLQDPDLKNMIQNMSEDYFEELKELYENSHPWADQRPFEAHVISFDRHLRRKPLPPDAESHLASTLISDLMSRFGVTSRQAPALVGLMYGTRDLMYDDENGHFVYQSDREYNFPDEVEEPADPRSSSPPLHHYGPHGMRRMDKWNGPPRRPSRQAEGHSGSCPSSSRHHHRGHSGHPSSSRHHRRGHDGYRPSQPRRHQHHHHDGPCFEDGIPEGFAFSENDAEILYDYYSGGVYGDFGGYISIPEDLEEILNDTFYNGVY